MLYKATNIFLDKIQVNITLNNLELVWELFNAGYFILLKSINRKVTRRLNNTDQ